MKKITAALLTLALAGTLAACGGEQSPATNSQPAADNSQAASDPAAASGSVTTLGSTSMNDVMNYLAEGFREVNGNVTVTVEGGGSSAGVEAALTGTADIGLASRALDADEEAQGLVGTTLALDGIAVIVDRKSVV